jgi:heterodisulfide reductase subunit C
MSGVPAPSTGRIVIGEKGSYFLKKVEGETGVDISACYQCEKCTNACPVSQFMDVKPHQVIRHIQLGWRRKLLGSTTLWVCLSCEMCTTYCPNSVDVAAVVNYLRNVAAHSSIEPRERSLAVFHQTFLEELHRYGRINELWLMNAFNLKPRILKEKLDNGTLREEMMLGLTLWRKGKLNMLPKRCKAIREIKDLYRRKRGNIR